MTEINHNEPDEQNKNISSESTSIIEPTIKQKQNSDNNSTYSIRVSRKLPYYLGLILCAVIISFLSYNTGKDNGQKIGYEKGKKEAVLEKANEEYARGYVQCYSNNLGGYDNVVPGWYVIKVDKTELPKTDNIFENDRYVKDLIATSRWQLFYKDQLPLKISSLLKMGSDRYFIKNDQVWFQDGY